MLWENREPSTNVEDRRPGQENRMAGVPILAAGASLLPLLATLGGKPSLGTAATKAGMLSGFGASNLANNYLIDNSIIDLDAPRRAAWSAFGVNEDGVHLVANALGLDPGGLAAAIGGGVLESVFDPLNLATAGIGGLVGKAAAKFAPRATASLASKLADTYSLGSPNAVANVLGGAMAGGPMVGATFKANRSATNMPQGDWRIPGGVSVGPPMSDRDREYLEERRLDMEMWRRNRDNGTVEPPLFGT